MVVPIGMPAPDRAVQSSFGTTVRLRDLHGKNVVLAFYPGDWTPVCSGQIPAYSELADEFASLNAVVFGVSVDSVASHRAWAADRNLRIPLLADFEPKGALAQAFGVYNFEHGTTERALVILDKEGIVRWTHVSGYQEDPGAAGILRALEELERGSSSIKPDQLSIVKGMDHVLGSGSVTLVEYADLECPDCKQAHGMLKRLRETSDVRFIFRHFPVRSSHPHSYLAAEATEAAGAQGKFWEMVDKLFENQKSLKYHDIMRYGYELGLDMDQFKDHIDCRLFSSKVHDHFMSGVRSGVTGTPTYFVNGEKYKGKKDFDALSEAIQFFDATGRESVVA
jgi:peroxiredoxin/2-hydroxychromene-2-carboxylate isomerase